MNENGLGKKSNFIPEVFAGANNIKNRELKKASKQKYTMDQFKVENINFGKNKNYGQIDLLKTNKPFYFKTKFDYQTNFFRFSLMTSLISHF